MNILLHTCCAPCLIYPLEVIKKEGHLTAGFFYNPNIHPYSEYLKRKSEVDKYAKEAGLNVISPEYEPENYFQHITYNESSHNRCPICWWVRMEKAGKFAKENGFDAFTTTLLVSPHQDQAAIKSICEDIAGRLGIKFYDKDFRPGFKSSHETAKTKGIYCQNYCGCIFSEKNSIEKRSAKKNKKDGLR